MKAKINNLIVRYENRYLDLKGIGAPEIVAERRAVEQFLADLRALVK